MRVTKIISNGTEYSPRSNIFEVLMCHNVHEKNAAADTIVTISNVIGNEIGSRRAETEVNRLMGGDCSKATSNTTNFTS